MTKSKLIILISSIAAAIVIAVTVILVVVLNSKPKPTNNEGDLREARTIKIVQLEGTATLYDGTERNQRDPAPQCGRALKTLG